MQGASKRLRRRSETYAAQGSALATQQMTFFGNLLACGCFAVKDGFRAQFFFNAQKLVILRHAICA